MSAVDDVFGAFPPHTRIPNDELLEVYVELTNNGEYDLLPYEEEWKQRGPLLEYYGYKLRQRYTMDWQPSWVDTNLNPFYCEDSIDSSTPNVMDAIRTHDGLPVAIKATLGWTREASIAFLFTDGNAIEEPRNHCVPILDTFIEEDIVYLVMPLLRAFNDPPFVTVAEVIDFVDQMVQGIEYMHEQNVAHRDITIGNIMMDASELYPEGFHPIRQNLARDGLAEVVGVMRTHAPVRYYLIDFDSAIAFEKGTPTRLKYAEGKAGRDDEVPEFRIKAPYDPFKVDIFQFGNLLRKEFLQKYSGVEFLEALVKEMTRPNAAERPTATKLRLKFNTIRNRLTAPQMRTHLELKDITDPLRERLLALGIESLLDSETDDSPEQSSSEAPTTGNSTRSHDSYWSVDPSLDSSITSQSSIEQGSHGPFHMITSALSRSRSPARTNSKGPDSKPSVWKPAKMADRQRSPSPPPVRSEPDFAPKSSSSQDEDALRPSARSSMQGPYLRTGKFPWSRSSSPDSSGSPILAVVNQFLSPEVSGLYPDDGLDYVSSRPHDNQKGWSQNTYASTYSSYGPSKNELPPQTAVPPVTAPQNTGAQQSAPGRNRRNTVSTAKAVSSFDNAPPSFVSPSQLSGSHAERGWGTINSVYEEPEANYDQPFYAEQGAKSSLYGKYNKSVNALPLSLNQSQWDYGAPQKETVSIDQFNTSPVDFWGTDNIAKSMTQAPPKPATATKPVERRASPVEKSAKPTKPTIFVPSKKNPAPQLASSSPPMPTPAPTRPSLAATTVNRKSTIGVEDATPYNTPPKTTVSLPPPTNTSPTTAKVKKTKSKKGSISEMPKEKENEKEKVSNPMDDPLSLRSAPEEISTIRGKRRGSNASNTSVSTSPLASLFGSKPTAEPVKDVPPKPATTTKSSFGFGWGSKPKAPAPADLEPAPGAFSFGSFGSFVSKLIPTEDPGFSSSSLKSTATSFAPGIFNEEEAPAQPAVTTPPQKPSAKSQSYFPSDDQPIFSPPKNEDEELARLIAQMAIPPKGAKISSSPEGDMFGKSNLSSQFGSSDGTPDKKGNSGWSTKAKPGFSAFKNDKSEAAASATPTFATMKPVKATSDPFASTASEPNGLKAKAKKVGKPTTKSTIAVESPVPTPTTEAEDPWAMVAPTKNNVQHPQKSQRFDEYEQTESYSDWYSVPGGLPGKEAEYDDVAELENAEEQYDPWFSPEEVKPKAKVSAIPPAPATKVTQSGWSNSAKLTKAKKTSKFASFGEEPVDMFGNGIDGSYDEGFPSFLEPKEEFQVKAKDAKKTKLTKEPEIYKKPQTTSQASKWSNYAFGAEDPKDDEDDLAAELAATLDAPTHSQAEPAPPTEIADKDAEKEEAAASNVAAKANPPKGKGKKKGKR